MAGVIHTGSHPAAVWPGIHAWFGAKYNEYPALYREMFDVKTSKKAYEEDVLHTGFGLAPIKGESAALSYDSESQGFTKRYTHVAYALGYKVTREELKDNLYEELSKRRSGKLAFSMRQTIEVVCANIMDRATNGSYTGGDGKSMLATDHPSIAGDWSNELATPADFMESSLEDILIQISQAKDERGKIIALQGEKLIVPSQLMFEPERVLKSTLRSGTANNDINAVRSMGVLPKGVLVNPFLTDTDQWFVKTNAPNGLCFFDRESVEFDTDNDFDTKNACASAYMRFSAGWSNPRGVYGSPGN